jgi:hypothetical protein
LVLALNFERMQATYNFDLVLMNQTRGIVSADR